MAAANTKNKKTPKKAAAGAGSKAPPRITKKTRTTTIKKGAAAKRQMVEEHPTRVQPHRRSTTPVSEVAIAPIAVAQPDGTNLTNRARVSRACKKTDDIDYYGFQRRNSLASNTVPATTTAAAAAPKKAPKRASKKATPVPKAPKAPKATGRRKSATATEESEVTAGSEASNSCFNSTADSGSSPGQDDYRRKRIVPHKKRRTGATTQQATSSTTTAAVADENTSSEDADGEAITTEAETTTIETTAPPTQTTTRGRRRQIVLVEDYDLVEEQEQVTAPQPRHPHHQEEQAVAGSSTAAVLPTAAGGSTIPRHAPTTTRQQRSLPIRSVPRHNPYGGRPTARRTSVGSTSVSVSTNGGHPIPSSRRPSATGAQVETTTTLPFTAGDLPLLILPEYRPTTLPTLPPLPNLAATTGGAYRHSSLSASSTEGDDNAGIGRQEKHAEVSDEGEE